MKNKFTFKADSKKCSKGFTLIELLVVCAIAALLIAISLPSFNAWRQNLSYRQTGRGVASLLREAMGIAVSTNRQQRIVLDGLVDGTYRNFRLEQGNRAVLTNTWQTSTRVSNTTFLQNGIGIQAVGSINGVQNIAQTLIVLNPNGSMQFSGNPVPALNDITMRLNIMSTSVNPPVYANYRIDLTQTGRISSRTQ